MKIFICLVIAIAAVLAEPPVPGNQYLPANNGPPSPGYGPPSNGGGPGNKYGPPSPPGNKYGPPNGGNGNGNGGYEDNNEPASYQFEYMVQDAESGNDFGHQESREGDVAQGKYYVMLPDGRKQIVEYTADNDGYHPQISYEGGGNGGGYPGGNGGGNGGGYPGGNGGGYPGGNGNGGYKY